MGQKVSPVGMRVGVIRDWESRWFAEKDYGDLLQEDIKIRKFLFKELAKDSVSRIEIERSKSKVYIAIRTTKSGAVVGNEEKVTRADGTETVTRRIDRLKDQLAKMTGKQIEIHVLDIANPDLDAQIVAQSIAEQLEARASFRSAQKKAIQKTMKSGAKGIKTLVSGRLGGADIARSEGYSEGVVPLHTIRADIDFAKANARTTYGILGVKVWICRGEVLGGEMVKEPEAPKTSGFNRNDRRRNNRAPRAERPAEEKPVEAKEAAE